MPLSMDADPQEVNADSKYFPAKHGVGGVLPDIIIVKAELPVPPGVYCFPNSTSYLFRYFFLLRASTKQQKAIPLSTSQWRLQKLCPSWQLNHHHH